MNVSYKMHAEVQGQLVESILFVMWILRIKFRQAIGALLARLSSFLNVRSLWMVLGKGYTTGWCKCHYCREL